MPPGRRARNAPYEVPVGPLVEMMHQAGDEHEIPRLRPEILRQRIAGSVRDALSHPLSRQDRLCVLDCFRQIATE